MIIILLLSLKFVSLHIDTFYIDIKYINKNNI